jgi:PadR family transcriptional regulator PadR
MPPTAPPSRTELLRGTLDMLVLKTLTTGPMHGYGIAQHLQRVSQDALRVEEGSLYPSLQRMRQKGWISAAWKQTPNHQRARYYTITAAGRKQLGAEESSFTHVLAAIARVMRPA